MKLLSAIIILFFTLSSYSQQEYVKLPPKPGRYDCYTYSFTPDFKALSSGIGSIELDANGNYKMIHYPSIKGTYKYVPATDKVKFSGGFLAELSNEYRVLQDKKDTSKSFILHFKINKSQQGANKYGFKYLISGEHHCFCGKLF